MGIDLKWRLLFIEEAIDLFNIVSSPRWGKSIEHQFAVAFGVEADVEDSHYAAIIACAQQASKALFEAQHGLWQHVNAEPVFSGRLHLCYARFVHGVVGRIKGEFIDNHQREGLSRDIDAFPEAFQTKEHGAFFLAKLACYLNAWPIPPAQ